MFDAALTLCAYLLGSVSAAIVTSKLMGLPDPRTEGSGNPGATNMLRLGGKKAAAITLLGDMLKGLIPVAVANALQLPPQTIAAVGLAAFLGHLYPVFFHFHGGKGVATALGVMLAMAWPVGLALLGTWLLIAKVFKISSLAALAAAIAAPVYTWWLAPEPAYIAVTVVFSLLLLWRHRSNIQRLLSGSEGHIKG